MNPTNQEPLAPAGLPETAPQGTELTPTPAPQPSAEPAAHSAATPSPDLAALQAELAQERAARAAAEKQAHDHQAAYTRSQQQLRAVVGEPQPQQDPLVAYRKPYIDMQLTDEAADLLARRDYQNEQRFNQLQYALAGQTQVPAAIQQAMNGYPQLNAVAQQLHSHIMEEVARGNPHATQPDYIRTIGSRFYLDQLTKAPNGTPPAQPTGPQFPSQFGPISGYQTPAQPAQPSNGVPPHIAQLAAAEKAAVAAKYNFPTQPKQ